MPTNVASAERKHFLCRVIAGIVVCTLSYAAGASSRITVIPFESYNLTPIADSSGDRHYVASLSGMLETAIHDTLGLEIVNVDPATTDQANAGFRYPTAAAQLAARYDADWIVVGRLHKPSFLFSYLMVRLIDVSSGEIAPVDRHTEPFSNFPDLAGRARECDGYHISGCTIS